MILASVGASLVPVKVADLDRPQRIRFVQSWCE